MDNTWSVRRLRPRGPAAAAAPAAPVEPTPSKPRKTQPKKKKTAAKKPPVPKSKSRTKKEEAEPEPEDQEDQAQAQDAIPAEDNNPPQEKPAPIPVPRLSPPVPRLSSHVPRLSPPVLRPSPLRLEHPPLINLSTRPAAAGPARNDESLQRSPEVSPPSPPRGSSSHHDSSSATLADDTPVRRPNTRFGVPLIVDTPEASTFVWGGSVNERPRQQQQQQWARPFDEEPRFRRPERPVFLESTPKVPGQPARVEQEGEYLYGLPIHRARRVKRCLSCLAGLFFMVVLGLGLLLIVEDAHRFRNLEDGEVLLLPVHQPVLDLSDVLMGFASGPGSTDKLLRRSSEYLDNICQGPYKWEELRTYKKPSSENWESSSKANRRRDNMTSLFLSSAKNETGMREVVKQCQAAKALIQDLSRSGPTHGTAQKMALQDTARVVEEIQARLTTTVPQGGGAFTDLKGSILSWIRPDSVSNETTLWQDQQQVMNRYLLSLDKLGKDVTKAFEEVPVEEPLSRTRTPQDSNQIGGPTRKKSVPIWKRWLRHPLGSSLELAHLFKNNALDLYKLSKSISNIDDHMTESCQNQDSKTRAGCPHTWPIPRSDRPMLDLEFQSLDSRDKARRIAGALDWIDLERKVLRAILKTENSKGPGLLDGECEVVLDSTKKGTGATISTRGWIHPDPMSDRGQHYSPLPICAPTRVFRPSTERLDCKVPGSETDYWHDAWNMMGHTFGLPSRFEREISWARDTIEDSNAAESQQARDMLWRHDLKISQKSSVWAIVMEQVPHPKIKGLRDSVFWDSSPMRGIRLPSIEEQDIRLSRAVARIRMFLWQYS